MSHNPVRNSGDFLVFGAPLIGEEEKREVMECLETGWLGTGPKVARFEQLFREYVQGRFSVALNSCTAAMHLSLKAAGIGPGDEVITTPMTFCATVNSIIHSGATPVLADVDPQTFNIDPEQVKEKITDKTKAILPVHFAGRPCNMDALCQIAKKHHLILIEDCAHAIETLYKGRHAGTFGDFGCFSFYVTKNVTTGEGGMVVTDREDLAHRIKVLALHGMTKDAWHRYSDEGYKHYQVVECGFKYNMMDIQAALGIHQLERIEKNWLRRQEIWGVYQQELKELPLLLPVEVEEDTRHAYHLYTVLVDHETCDVRRDQLLTGLTQENIGAGVHYMSIPTHQYYKERFGWNALDYPRSFLIGQQTISLPLSAKLSDDDVFDVIRAIKKVLRVV